MSERSRLVYPPAIAELLGRMPLAPLGPGQPRTAVRPLLEALSDDALGGRIVDRDMAACCRAALWLAFDFLDESHTISQGISTVEGSYWHAIMHRREPDHSNAAYWLRKVGTHPIHANLARAADGLGYAGNGPGWDAFAFNNSCERHRGKGDATEELLRKVQRAEWDLLFAYCFRRATGRADRR
jgi:hypothetical protein